MGQLKSVTWVKIASAPTYVNPGANTVIVKLSVSPNYGKTNDETSWRESKTIELSRTIANSSIDRE